MFHATSRVTGDGLRYGLLRRCQFFAGCFQLGGAQFHGDAPFAERELGFVLSLPSSLALVLEP